MPTGTGDGGSSRASSARISGTLGRPRRAVRAASAGLLLFGLPQAARCKVACSPGFARDAIMAWCGADRVAFLLGLARHSRLVGMIAEPRAATAAERLASGKPARHFAECAYATRDNRTRGRRVIAKAEQTGRRRQPRRCRDGNRRRQPGPD